MKTVSLSMRKCKINGDMCTISVRDHKTNTAKQTNFKDEKEAFEKYLKLSSENSDKITAPKKEVIEEIKVEDLKEDVKSVEISNDDIIKYVESNSDLKGVKSARHLNKEFKLKLKQKEYDEILKGL